MGRKAVALKTGLDTVQLMAGDFVPNHLAMVDKVTKHDKNLGTPTHNDWLYYISKGFEWGGHEWFHLPAVRLQTAGSRRLVMASIYDLPRPLSECLNATTAVAFQIQWGSTS